MINDPRNEIKIEPDLNPHYAEQEMRFQSNAQRLKPRSKQKGINAKFIAIGMMVVGLIGFGVLTAIQYLMPGSDKPAEIPVLKADDKPDRIVPDEKGGIEIPHRDKAIFTRLKPGTGVNVEEVIIQEPEKPIVQKREQGQTTKSDMAEAEKIISAPDKTTSVQENKQSVPLKSEKIGGTPFDLSQEAMNNQALHGEEDDDAAHEEPLLNAAEITAKSQHLPPGVSVKEEDRASNQVASTEPIIVTEPFAQHQADTTEPVQEAQAVPNKNKSLEIVEQKTTAPKASPNATLPSSTPKVNSEAADSAAPISSNGGQFRIQLGSMKTKDAAKEEWARLQKQNPELRSLELLIDEVKIPDKGTFYRIQGGKVTKEQAASLCQSLKKRNTACFVVKG